MTNMPNQPYWIHLAANSPLIKGLDEHYRLIQPITGVDDLRTQTLAIVKYHETRTGPAFGYQTHLPQDKPWDTWIKPADFPPLLLVGYYATLANAKQAALTALKKHGTPPAQTKLQF